MADTQALGSEKRSLASPALIRALRGEGINPSSLKFGTDGSIHVSADREASEVPSDDDVWNAAGKL
jgi:hypothetical protein